MSVNKVILIGNVGKDPEVRYLDSGVAVATVTIATSERGYTTANGVEIPEKTEWHNVTLWRKQAEFAEKWIKKGASVYVEGKLTTRTWEDQQGNKRYATEIMASDIQFVGRKSDAQETGQSSYNNSTPRAAAPSAAAPSVSPFGTAEASDDLPF